MKEIIGIKINIIYLLTIIGLKTYPKAKGKAYDKNTIIKKSFIKSKFLFSKIEKH